MSKDIGTGRLELDHLEWFIKLSKLVGFRQFGFSDIRARQDAQLTERVRQRALARIEDPQLIRVTDSSFFLGSVDYMVRDGPDGGRAYTALETNGGSSRGLTLLAPPDVERLIRGFVEMLRFVEADAAPLLVVGYPVGDSLLTEKFLVMHRLKEALEQQQPDVKVHVVSIEEYRVRRPILEEEAVIVLAPHSQTALSLQLRGDRVYLLDRRVHLIIGDGAVAQHPRLGHQRADVVLANWIFPVTGDKSATYDATEQARDLVTPHGMYPLRFWQAKNREMLEQICERQRSEVDGLIIKPFRGSGGTGVLPVLADSAVAEVVEDSLGEFKARYGHAHNPFPYTVCEKINPHKAAWRGGRHNFDIRVYVARQGDELRPVGCLFRLAPRPDKGDHSKDSLIVNLSGYGGMATQRGLGLSRESLETVGLEDEDMVKIFAASTVLMAAIAHQSTAWPS
ncbi:MAG: hypothetical protein PVF54_03230 [Anaerolineae bacterium]|jgi:hypothetical protein